MAEINTPSWRASDSQYRLRSKCSSLNVSAAGLPAPQPQNTFVPGKVWAGAFVFIVSFVGARLYMRVFSWRAAVHVGVGQQSSYLVCHAPAYRRSCRSTASHTACKHPVGWRSDQNMGGRLTPAGRFLRWAGLTTHSSPRAGLSLLAQGARASVLAAGHCVSWRSGRKECSKLAGALFRAGGLAHTTRIGL